MFVVRSVFRPHHKRARWFSKSDIIATLLYQMFRTVALTKRLTFGLKVCGRSTTCFLLILVTANVLGQNSPFGEYFMPPKNSGTTEEIWKVWSAQLQPKQITTRFLSPTLTEIDADLAKMEVVDSIFYLKDVYYFIVRKKDEIGDQFEYTAVKLNKNKDAFASSLLWQLNGWTTKFYSVNDLIEHIKTDTLQKWFGPLYSKGDAIKFTKGKTLDKLKERDMIVILQGIEKQMDRGREIYLSLSEAQRQYYRVHRFHKISIYGGYFFEQGYNPMVSEVYIKKWKKDFQSNPELAALMDKLF
jgi:hypothetical protein